MVDAPGRDAFPDAEELRRALAHAIAAGDEDLARPLAEHPAMPEDALLDLCERGLCLGELGHRAGPRRLLERMASLHAYPEAILTLALDLYRDPGEPLDAFAAHARAHATHAWMLRALAEVDASGPEKEAFYESLLGASADAAAFHARLLARRADVTVARLEAFLAAHADPWVLTLLLRTPIDDGDKLALVRRMAASRPDADAITEALARAEACDEARSPAITPARAEALFAANDPEVLLELAGNAQTPRAILEQLAERRTTHLAKPTRARARGTLRRAR
jgi:hypothetical protein